MTVENEKMMADAVERDGAGVDMPSGLDMAAEPLDIPPSEDRYAPEGREDGEEDTVERDGAPYKVSVFDLLPAEAFQNVNRLGYEFLAEHGYDALGAWDDAEKHAAIEKALAERGEELRYSYALKINDSTRCMEAILIWYGLYDREGRCIARSQGYKLAPKNMPDGEVRDEQ